MTITNAFKDVLKSTASVVTLAAGLLSVSIDEALAAGPELMTERGLISADDVSVNQTLSFVLVKVSSDYEDTATYTMYHDGKSQILGVTIHEAGYVAVNGREMRGYEERDMYETLRDGLPRVQPDPANYRVPAVKYAINNGLTLGGAESPSGQYDTGFNAAEDWIGSCSIVDPERLICLTNVYNESASEYSARIDVYQVNDLGTAATKNTAEYSRAYNSQSERDRYEKFVDKNLQGPQTYR